LDRLIEAAQNRVKLVPDELTVADDRATIALVLGNIYSVLRQYDLAKGWFSLPLNGSLRSRSAGHRSFAGLGLADAVPGEKSEQMAKDADALFNRLCEAYPKSPYVGDACVRQIDFALERKYDLKLATALFGQGLRWAKDQDVQVVTAADGKVTRQSVEDAARAIRDASAKLPEWADPGAKPAAALLDDLYNLYFRAAILAYLGEKYDDAAKYLDAAGPARPTEGMRANFDHQKVGLFILKECSRLKLPSWNRDAVKAAKTDSQRLAIKLADTYVHSLRPDKAEPIYQRLLSGDSSLGRPSKGVESYCLMQLALAHSKSSEGVARATELYARLYRPEYAKYPWTPTGILRLGVLTFNTTHDAKTAMAHYQYVFTKYPDHPEADRAMYFYRVAARRLGDKALLAQTAERFLEMYPKSAFKSSVMALASAGLPGQGPVAQGDKSRPSHSQPEPRQRAGESRQMDGRKRGAGPTAAKDGYVGKFRHDHRYRELRNVVGLCWRMDTLGNHHD
jgi:tetratricopeptide (TPR) repeat protein